MTHLVVDDLGSYTRRDDPGEPSTGVPRVSVTHDEAELLAFMARGLRVLEIGTGLGISTNALARTASHVVTVDVDPWVKQQVAPELPVNVFHTHTRTLAREHFDLVFIDGDHSPEALREDLEFARLTGCWYIVCHDCNYPNVAEVLADDESEWIEIKTAHGLAIAIGPWA